MKSPQRVFLDWQRPALLAAVEWLRRKYGPAAAEASPKKPAKRKNESQRLLFEEGQASGDLRPPLAVGGSAWDLSRVIVVMPGKRAGRRLLELLVFSAQDERLQLTPPNIITEGRLPELLYCPQKPFADDLTQDLAWSHALRQLPKKQLNAIAPHPPEKDDESGWLQLGHLLRGRHTELAADRLMFADVVRHGRTLATFPDAARWQAMQAAQETYHRTLDELKLWDIQTARLKAIEFKEIETNCDIVLLGTVDLNRTLRTMLDMVADHATALVAAPESLADRFDSHGCVLPDQWKEATIPLRDEQLRRVDGPADQADAVAQIMAGYAGRYRGDQITIGVPDERLVPHLQRQLEQCQTPVRWVEGKLLPATGPYRLLDAVAELLRSDNLRSMSALLRHPDLFAWLSFGKDEESRVALPLLNELDRLQSDYLVTRLNPKHWPLEVRRKLEEAKDFQNVVKALEQVQELLAPLRVKPQRLAAWSQPIIDLLQSVYKDNCDLATLDYLEKLRDILQAHTSLPEPLDPPLAAEEAIQWTLQQLRTEALPPPSNEDAVELLGWLELPLDDAPAVIVTSFNEGFTPQTTSGDAFLPNSLRTGLGLLDNDRRYARDAYAVSAIQASRESVHWITARRDAETNPLIPSRLLFAAEPKQVVDRARRFFGELPPSAPRRPLIGVGVPAPVESRLFVPYPPADLPLPTRLRVTQFKDYLACPYRFCLRHLMKLEGVDDACEELAANAFGNLLHAVLERFGADAGIRDSDKPDDIADYLNDQLQRAANRRYGDRDRLAAVEIQLKQLQQRLNRFAEWQAWHRSEGWRIVYTETTKDEAEPATPEPQAQPPRERDVEVEVDGQPFLLGGRIDRIDQHEESEVYRVLDYKTGDRGEKPEQVHRRWNNGVREWVDLQLPLYRHLAEDWGFEGTKELGYILIPKSLDDIGHEIARWSEAELTDADETMREVVRRIRNRQFWPPQEVKWPDEFVGLCQDRRQGGRLLDPALAEGSRP
jgi:hypothetical protein